ncbi:MAG TPA: hypothetical protein VII16_15395, partial [Actinomycetes bacterium]
MTTRIDARAARRPYSAWPRIPLRTAGFAMATVAMFVVVACGAGQKTATSEDVPAIPGADAAAGPIVLRDLLIPFQEQGYPPGSDVPLVV